jgi:hypothetical protein
MTKQEPVLVYGAWFYSGQQLLVVVSHPYVLGGKKLLKKLEAE